MQVLLPDFAFHQDHELGKFPKGHGRNLSFLRARTMEARRMDTTNTSRNKDIDRLHSNKKMEDVSFYLPKTERLIPNNNLRTFRSSQLESFVFLSPSQQHPIHSRRTTKFVTSSLSRRKSNIKPPVQAKKKVYEPSFNFLKTQKYSFNAKQVLDPEIIEYQVKVLKPFPAKRNSSSNFPSKKVKSAFVKQEYRPWSPKKGQGNFDQLSS